jgi:hypothetical protein
MDKGEEFPIKSCLQCGMYQKDFHLFSDSLQFFCNCAGKVLFDLSTKPEWCPNKFIIRANQLSEENERLKIELRKLLSPMNEVSNG